jgi:hypothetical protein
MTEKPENECLFIGGTADGKRLAVDPSQAEQRVPSKSHLPAMHDPAARALDDDPVPDESVAVEVYRRMEVVHGGETSVIFAMKNLSEDGVRRRLPKYFGTEEVTLKA